jgi:hypothetical protein
VIGDSGDVSPASGRLGQGIETFRSRCKDQCTSVGLGNNECILAGTVIVYPIVFLDDV